MHHLNGNCWGAYYSSSCHTISWQLTWWPQLGRMVAPFFGFPFKIPWEIIFKFYSWMCPLPCYHSSLHQYLAFPWLIFCGGTPHFDPIAKQKVSIYVDLLLEGSKLFQKKILSSHSEKSQIFLETSACLWVIHEIDSDNLGVNIPSNIWCRRERKHVPDLWSWSWVSWGMDLRFSVHLGPFIND